VRLEMELAHPATTDFDGFFAVEFPVIARAAWFVVLDTEVAKEIAQEAFCRALQRWDRISGYERPGAWVRTVAIRLALRSRDRRRRELVLTEVTPATPTTPAGPRATTAMTTRSSRRSTTPTWRRPCGHCLASSGPRSHCATCVTST
jgi:DNA-directed RNA polymerase specialized sigma24 family protein